MNKNIKYLAISVRGVNLQKHHVRTKLPGGEYFQRKTTPYDNSKKNLRSFMDMQMTIYDNGQYIQVDSHYPRFEGHDINHSILRDIFLQKPNTIKELTINNPEMSSDQILQITNYLIDNHKYLKHLSLPLPFTVLQAKITHGKWDILPYNAYENNGTVLRV